jgi:hypothetical protein
MPSTVVPEDVVDELEYFDEVIYPWVRNGALLEFDASDRAMAPFGGDLSPGTRVRLTVGEWDGIESTIIGVRQNFLWRHDDGERGARAFKGTSRAFIDETYGLEVIGKLQNLQGLRKTLRAAQATQTSQQSAHGKQSQAAASASTAALPFIIDAASFADTSAIPSGGVRVKKPVQYCAPVSARFPAGTLPPLVTYECAQELLLQFGAHVRAGMHLLLRRGARAGTIATVIGMYDGRLVYHSHDGSWPREFEATDLSLKCEINEIHVVLDDTLHTATSTAPRGASPNNAHHHRPHALLRGYPQDLESYRGVEYRTAASAMLRCWGLLHGHRVQHQSGPRLGCTGVIIGSKSDVLYELCIETGAVEALVGGDGSAIRAHHGLVPIGYWCGDLPLTSSFTAPDLRRSGVRMPIGAPRLIDERLGAFIANPMLTARCGGGGRNRVMPGASVRMRCGTRTGQVGIVVGVTHRPPTPQEAQPLSPTFWALFDDVSSRLDHAADRHSSRSADDSGLTVEEVRVDNGDAALVGRPRATLPFLKASADPLTGNIASAADAARRLSGSHEDDAHGDFVEVPSAFGEWVDVNMDPVACCNQFGIAPGRKIVYCARRTFQQFARDACSRLGSNASLYQVSLSPFPDTRGASNERSTATLKALLPAQWSLGIVLGTCRRELCVLNLQTQTVEPLLGSSGWELATTTHIEVVGWYPERFAEIRDTFRNRERATSVPTCALTFFEAPLQRDTDVRPLAILASSAAKAVTGEGDSTGEAPVDPAIGMTTARNAVTVIAANVANGRISPFEHIVVGVRTDYAAFAAAGVGQLAAGARIFHSPRLPPRLSRSRPSHHPSDTLSAGIPREEWTHYGPPEWFTVLGVLGTHVFLCKDTAMENGVAEGSLKAAADGDNSPAFFPAQNVVVRSSASLADAVAAAKDAAREAPLQHAALPKALIATWITAPLAVDAEASSPTAAAMRAVGDSVYPNFPVAHIDSAAVRAASEGVSKARAKEVRLLLSSFTTDDQFDVIELMLGCFRVDLKAGDTLLRACKMVAALVDVFGQRQLRPPTAAQWAGAFRSKFQAIEAVRRREIEQMEQGESGQLRYRWAIQSHRSGLDASGGGNSSTVADWSFETSRRHESPTHVVVKVSDRTGAASAAMVVAKTTAETAHFALPRVALHYADATRGALDNPVVASCRTASASMHHPFPYVLANGTRATFDISVKACEPFSMFHGQQWRPRRGDAAGSVWTVIGTLDGCLWRYDDRGLEAAPLAGATFEAIAAEHDLELVRDVDRSTMARWPYQRSASDSRVRTADPFYFHTTDGLMAQFDVCDESMAKFGVHFGDRFASNALDEIGAWQRVVYVCIGVLDDRLWVARDWCGAYAHIGSNFAQDLRLVHLYQAPVRSLLKVWRSQPPRTVNRSVVVHAVVGRAEKRALDCTREACEPYGVYPGQFVVHTKGVLATQHATILGTFHGRLYRLVTGDRVATPFDTLPHEFAAEHGCQLIQWTRPPTLDVDMESCPALAQRLGRFGFTSFTGAVAYFDTRPSVCMATFGFTLGDVVNFQHEHRTGGAVRQAVVIGVRDGRLWKTDKQGADRNIATMFVDCSSQRDLVQLYDIALVGFEVLEEHVG